MPCASLGARYYSCKRARACKKAHKGGVCHTCGQFIGASRDRECVEPPHRRRGPGEVIA